LLLMVRPERVKIASDTTASGGNIFAATVSDIVYQGDSFLMYARLDGGAEVSLRGVIRSATLAALPLVGGPVTLALEPEDTLIIAGAEG